MTRNNLMKSTNCIVIGKIRIYCVELKKNNNNQIKCVKI